MEDNMISQIDDVGVEGGDIVSYYIGVSHVWLTPRS